MWKRRSRELTITDVRSQAWTGAFALLSPAIASLCLRCPLQWDVMVVTTLGCVRRVRTHIRFIGWHWDVLNNGFCDTLQRRWGATASYYSTVWNYYFFFLNCNLQVDTPVPGPLVGGDAQGGCHPPDLCSSVPGHSAQLHLLCGDSGDPELLCGLAALMSRKQNPVQTYMAL